MTDSVFDGGPLTRLKSGLGAAKRFAANRRGVAAIEFAFVAPLLIGLYFLSIEVSQAIDTNKKVGRLASMVADLVTQQPSVDKAALRGIMDVSNTVLFPYSRSRVNLVITGIQVSDAATPEAKVAWSYRKKPDGSFVQAEAAGTATTLPSSLTVAGSFLVRVEAQLAYKPILTWTAEQKANLGMIAAFDNINMGESYLLRPRMRTSISCDDC